MKHGKAEHSKYTTVEIKMDLENVKRVYCDEDYIWQFDIEDMSSTITRTNIQFRRTDELEVPNSRGIVNFMVRWTEHPKPATITFKAEKGSCEYEPKDEDWKKFGFFECRGLKLTKFIPTNGFTVEDTEGRIYENVDLSDGNWCEYNEDAQIAVCIYNFEHRIV